MRKRFDVDGLDPKAPLGENARAILKARIAEYYHYTPIVHDEQAGELLHEPGNLLPSFDLPSHLGPTSGHRRSGFSASRRSVAARARIPCGNR